MSKKSEYLARADTCEQLASQAKGQAREVLLEAEAKWRRLARACYDTVFGPEMALARRSRRLRLAR